jgi:hypothetical protein
MQRGEGSRFPGLTAEPRPAPQRLSRWQGQASPATNAFRLDRTAKGRAARFHTLNLCRPQYSNVRSNLKATGAPPTVGSGGMPASGDVVTTNSHISRLDRRSKNRIPSPNLRWV